MAKAECVFEVPGGTAGGRLGGPGFPAGGKPKMGKHEDLTMQLTWTGTASLAPAQLTGYFVFAAAPGAPSTQKHPSPFMQGGNYVCLHTEVAYSSLKNGIISYEFLKKFKYGGGLPGVYELTFVAEQGTGTTSAVQWSADPEFETGN